MPTWKLKREWLRRFALIIALALVQSLGFAPISTARADRVFSSDRTEEELIVRAQRLFDDQDYEGSIQVLSAAVVRPNVTKAHRVDILRLLALNCITLGRKEEADSAVRALLSIQPTYELPSTESPRFLNFFRMTKEKWVAEGMPGKVGESERTTRTIPVQIIHTSPSQAEPETQVTLTIRVDDPKQLVETLRLFFRTGSHEKFKTVSVLFESPVARVAIPARAVRPPFIEYFFLAYDKSGVAIASRGDINAPLRVAVPEPKGTSWVIPAAIGGGAVVAAAVVLVAAGVFKGGEPSSNSHAPATSTVTISVGQ